MAKMNTIQVRNDRNDEVNEAWAECRSRINGTDDPPGKGVEESFKMLAAILFEVDSQNVWKRLWDDMPAKAKVMVGTAIASPYAATIAGVLGLTS